VPFHLKKRASKDRLWTRYLLNYSPYFFLFWLIHICQSMYSVARAGHLGSDLTLGKACTP
jgi:hypothetical protein